MSATAETSALDAAAGDRLARRNALILAVAQALAGGNNVVLIATGAIVGAMLAPDRSLATVPVSIYVLGMWMGTLPRGWIARYYGRSATFFVGTGFGVRVHVPALRAAGFDVVALVGTDADRTERRAARVGVERWAT